MHRCISSTAFLGNRLQAALAHGQALASGIALVAFDRPGFGLSDPANAPTVDHIAGDVLDLSDALGHRRFAVLGVSCGGPHALAAARLIPERVVAVGLLAGIGPMDQPRLRKGQLPLLRAMFGLARWYPGLISPLLAADRWMFRGNPERAVKALSSMLTPPDRRLIEGSAVVRQAFAASLAEAYRQGIGGAMQEAGRIARFTTAQLDGVRAPVHVFQSGQDRNVPPAMGRFMAGAADQCDLPRLPGRGAPVDRGQPLRRVRAVDCARSMTLISVRRGSAFPLLRNVPCAGAGGRARSPQARRRCWRPSAKAASPRSADMARELAVK